MKKEITVFVSTSLILFFAVGTILNTVPLYESTASSAAGNILSVSMPYTNMKSYISQALSLFSDNSANNENTNNTSQEESSEVMNITGSEDSSDSDDLTQTPSDILALMAEEEEVISTQTIKGSTSEESYTGGGTIVTYSNVQIQNKIPSDFYSLNIEELLNQKADLKISDPSQPTVLIYHSHSTESYNLLDVGYYTESSGSKTTDVARNMVRVGDEICRILEARGIGVIHDTEIHDTSYNEAYSSSRQSVLEYLEEYPTIEITIDVHRDSITYSDGTKVKPTVVVNGKKAARMMIISGCEYGSVENFPDWEYNLRFACAVTEKLNTMYTDIMRPILFSERKYNMDLTKNSFLLEIGTDANTLEEACYSARLFANALAELILEEYS